MTVWGPNGAPASAYERQAVRRRRRAGPGWGLTIAIAVAALVAGAGGTLGAGRVRAGGHSPVDAQATQLAADLQAQLTPAVYSGGSKAGSLHTEGDFTALVQRDGGVVLTFGRGSGSRGATHAADVMLGLEPPAAGAAVPSYLSSGSGAVQCYQVSFGDYGSSLVTTAVIACPAARPDGKPGSVQAWLAGLFTAQSAGARQSATAYPATSAGLREFLSGSAPAGLRVGAAGGVAAAAFRNSAGDCFYARISAAPAAPPEEASALWLAPAQSQLAGCTAQAALAASALYGINAAAEG